VAAMALPHDPAFFLAIVFVRAAQNPHTPGGNAAVKKHMTASVHLTLTQHCRWGAGAYSTDLLKRQAQYFKC